MTTLEQMNRPEQSTRFAFDVKIILSALWAARMLSGLQGDVVRFMEPGMLAQFMDGTSQIAVTTELILIMSIVMAVPIFMSFLSLTLKDKVNRWANLIVGGFFVLWELVFLIFVYSQAAAYEMFWGFVYLIFVALVVWFAWKWPKRETEGHAISF